MEDNNRLDSLFRTAVEQYAESTEKVWNSLDARLEKKLAEKRRKKFFWFRFFPAIMVGLLSLGGY